MSILLFQDSRTEERIEGTGMGEELNNMNLKVGDRFTFTKTISESDVYLFAGITGDLNPNHVDEQFCKTTMFGSRIAHGALTFALCSTVCSRAASLTGRTCLLTGFDKVRFLKPVYLGDTLTASFLTTEINYVTRIFSGVCEVRNQQGEVVVKGICLQKWVRN